MAEEAESGVIRMKSLTCYMTAAATFVLLASPPAHAESKLAQIKSKIEGVYELVEWNDNGVIHKPPQATGRVYRVNGNHFFMVHNETAGGSVDYFGTGKYKITENSFSYGYDEENLVTRIGSDVHLGRLSEITAKDLRLPQMRKFNLRLENGVVKDEAVDKSIHAYETYDGETYVYTDNDKHQVRTYKRISGTQSQLSK